MSYTPNPFDSSEPTSDKFVETAAAEFRALKAVVNNLYATINYAGDWASLTGALAAGKTVSHTGSVWFLLTALADVTTSEPGVSADWLDLGNVKRSGDTMTGPLSVPAGASGAQVPQAQEVVPKVGGAARIPTWTTAGRPSSPSAGDTGFNTTLGAIETYNGSAWIQGGWQSSVVSASGSAVDFTGIPSSAKQIRIGFIGVSSTANDNFLFQLGDSGGVETTGYITHTTIMGATALSGTAVPTNGFSFASTVAAGTYHGFIDLQLLDASTFTWGGVGNFARDGTTTANYMVGTKALSAALDRVRVTFAGATTFDAGSISLLWRS